MSRARDQRDQVSRAERERPAAPPTGEEVMQELEEQWSRSQGGSRGWKWNREELYERVGQLGGEM